MAALLAVGAYWVGLIFVFGLMRRPPSLTGLASGSESTLEHIATHFVLGALVYLLILAVYRNAWLGAVMALFAAVAVGGSLEIGQLFVPDRDSQVGDFIADAFGAAAGIGMVALVFRLGFGFGLIVAGVTSLTLAGGVGVTIAAAIVIAGRPDTVSCDLDAMAAAPDAPEVTPAALPANGRQTTGLIAYYDFSEGEGQIAHDTSGVEPALDLRILDTSSIGWLSGSNGILISSADSAVKSDGPASKIYGALKATGQFTIEVWAAPSSLDTAGPARIVSLSDGKTDFDYNYQLGQSETTVRERLRTLCSIFNQGAVRNAYPAAGATYQVTATYDGLTLRDYIDGALARQRAIGGDLSNWDEGYPLLIGNETSLDRGFVGRVYLLAIYDRALSDDEIARNFQVGRE